ncbi:MAG: patatin-like phospholipase family protein [Bacteroidales bacterium]|nr:patatin-like phospholipase family protein [Bacteroidales bacterium]
MMFKKKKYNYGLVLSGGGTRGFAHLGVLKALEEHDIKPDIISGVSAGSIIGALYADGHPIEDILKTLVSKNLFGFLDFLFSKDGLVEMKGFEKTLKKTLRAENIEDLKIPLIIHAVNINTVEYTAFDKGKLVEAIIASSSIPVVFPPVTIKGNQYLDGGILNNFPVEPLVGHCKQIIGVNVNPVGRESNIKGLKKLGIRTFHLTMLNHAEMRKDKCSIFIQPENLEEFGILDLSSAEKVFEVGYKKAVEVLKKV